MAYIKVNDLSKGNDGLQSPILKFLSQKEIDSLFKFLDAKDGDTVFFGAGNRKIVSDSMGALRNKIAEMKTGEGKTLTTVSYTHLRAH